MTEERLFRIVIAGRPNVGKSTLFNRLLKKRRAITDPFPGVTRDAVGEKFLIDGNPVLLIDTGGYKVDSPGEFDESVTKKSLTEIQRADLILFLLDQDEIVAEDRALIEKLRPFQEKTIAVVNKIDSVEKEVAIYEAYNFGFSEVIGVSAAHGRNIPLLLDLLSARLEGVEKQAYEEDTSLKIAVLGKPNTGKSTLTNLLTQSNNSIVSPIAGTTRDVIEGQFSYDGQKFTILDTAGIRRKAKVSENIEYYSVNRAIKSIDEADIIFLMIDGPDGISDQDKKISTQITKHGKGVIIVLNKDDLIEDGEKGLKDAIEKVRFNFPILSYAPVVTISALKGKHIKQLMKKTVEIYKQLHTRVETGELNRAVREWCDFTPLPAIKGKVYKVRYATQVSMAPVKVILFVNRKRGFPESYLRYLLNKMRKSFGFDLIPVDIEIKEGKK